MPQNQKLTPMTKQDREEAKRNMLEMLEAHQQGGYEGLQRFLCKFFPGTKPTPKPSDHPNLPKASPPEPRTKEVEIGGGLKKVYGTDGSFMIMTTAPPDEAMSAAYDRMLPDNLRSKAEGKTSHPASPSTTFPPSPPKQALPLTTTSSPDTPPSKQP